MLLLLLRRTETRPEEDAGEEPLRSGTRLGLRVLRGRAESSVSSVGEPNAAAPRNCTLRSPWPAGKGKVVCAGQPRVVAWEGDRLAWPMAPGEQCTVQP